MTKLTPDMFKLSFMEEAHLLRRTACANSRSSKLDERTSMWVIRMEAWRDFMASSDFLTVAVVSTQRLHGRRNELLGLPVRLTIDDEPDVPMIQLVMEPEAKPRR
ncbi:hypothetical protein NL532_24140 [Mesorhizobium sp. C120A]|uniref:hypothetical protein n=1 Tax=unclassified Mesorhizobium TaxID=325217 RepID=UPI00040BC53C|nr:MULTISPECIES: hypothetical protein [unclassified Mesorhizobium]WJI43700.1 hypothetical protein NL532_24140 [Mesorhizobium sp. C120A]